LLQTSINLTNGMVWSLKNYCFIYLMLCGQQFEARTNHENADSKDFPWVAAVYKPVGYFNIGTGLILTKSWVITPAHFWKEGRFTTKNAAIKYGATVNKEGEGQVGTIMDIVINPRFHRRENDMVFDIALLQMDPVLKLNWHFSDAFPIDDESLLRGPGELCEVAGYGVEEDHKADDLRPRQLRKMQVVIKDMDGCLAKMQFSQEMFCAGSTSEGNLCPVSEIKATTISE
jgi:Trypsin